LRPPPKTPEQIAQEINYRAQFDEFIEILNLIEDLIASEADLYEYLESWASQEHPLSALDYLCCAIEQGQIPITQEIYEKMIAMHDRYGLRDWPGDYSEDSWQSLRSMVVYEADKSESKRSIAESKDAESN
jgi:hypothetical protein